MVYLLLLCLCFAALPQDCYRIRSVVPLWGIFEAEFPNNRAYDDPFREVILKMEYEAPDGSQTDFWGFYAGDGMWKARFMPDQIGTWRYTASFSDRAQQISGAFEVEQSDLPGLVSTDVANPNWFGYAGGRHAVIRGFHVGDRFFAANWSDAARTIFLDWAEKQGYNLLSVASFFLNRDAEGRGKGWETPDLWDNRSKAPRPEAYAQAEGILDDLSERQIAVYPFAGFFGQSSDFPRNREDQELYLRYTMARFGPYWNLLFNVAGPEPLWRPNEFGNVMNASEIIRLGKRIRERDPFGHLISIHNEAGPDPFRHEAWQGYVTLQGGKEDPAPSVHRYLERNSPGGKPVFAQEVFWPGNKWHGCDCTDAETIRKKAFLILFAGGAINFADMDGNSSTGFSGSLDLNGRHQDRHDAVKEVWDWFDSIPFYRMIPVRNLATNGFTLAERGVQYAIYTLDARETIRLDLSDTSGEFILRWYDPAEKEWQEAPESLAGGQVVILPAPDVSGSTDRVALISREHPVSFQEMDGRVVMEAENAFAVEGWVEVPGESGRAMRDESARGEGYLTYPLSFATPGTYYLYMLMRRTDPEHADKSNDAFVSFAGRKVFAADGQTRPDGIRCSETAFSWQSMPKGPGAHTPRDIFHDPIYVRVPAAGTYTLQITSRSSGFEVDKMILTREAVTPTGNGPAETRNLSD